MPLSPPVVFLNGTWQDNFSQLKSMDLTEYGFQVTSGINSAWIDSDPNNINGSDRIIAVGNLASTGLGSAVVLMGYFSLSLVSYSNNPDAPDYNPTFSNRIKFTASSRMSLALVAYYSPSSSSDSRIKFVISTMENGYGATYGFKFNEVRIMRGGLLSNTERWGISIAGNNGYSPTIVAYNSYSNSRISTARTAGSDGILDASTENIQYASFNYNTPGESVLVQFKPGVPLYKASSCWIPGMPPFVIWDGRIFGSIQPGVYLEMGSAFI